MKKTPICDIIVLVWNNLEYTKPCIESVLKKTTCPSRLLIVDNNSDNLTKLYLQNLKSTEHVEIKLITNKENLGFVGGNNVGLKASSAPFSCILNNDTLVTKGWLSEMIRVANLREDIGIVNPNSNNFGICLKGSETVDTLSKELLKLEGGGFREIGSTIGFCMLVKRQLIEKIGYLDDFLSGFFFEDTDYSYRAKEIGFICVIAKGAYVHHYEHKSVQKLSDRQKKFDESRQRFYQKWGRPLRIMAVTSNTDLDFLRDFHLKCLEIARQGNFVDFTSKSQVRNGLSNNISHSDLRTMDFPAQFFNLRCLWRSSVKKKRYDIIFCPDVKLAEQFNKVRFLNKARVTLSITKGVLEALRRIPAKYVNFKERLNLDLDINDTIDCILAERYLKSKRPWTSYLPFHYHLVPGSIRVLIAQWLTGLHSLKRQRVNFPNWPEDITVDLLKRTIRGKLSQIKWPEEKKYAVCLTHDIDTNKGFKPAEKFLHLEAEFGVKSCWFVVLKNVEFGGRFFHEVLKGENEVACHGDNHDESLPYLSQSEICSRLEKYRNTIKEYNMKGFRSPSLLRTPTLLRAISEFFEYDSTFPDTEISARPPYRSGCCSIFPYRLGKLMELPLTLPQDSTCVFLKKTPEEILKLWLNKLSWIKEMGGLATLNIHPDSHFGMKGKIFDIYRSFLEIVTKDTKAWVITPAEVVNHCANMELTRVEL